MLSSALRLGFSRVSMAAKRSLVPAINAGIFVIVVNTFRSSLTFVHVELAVWDIVVTRKDSLTVL